MKKSLRISFLMVLISLCAVMCNPVLAKAATSKSKSATVTLDTKKNKSSVYQIALKSKAKYKITIKVLSMSGTAKDVVKKTPGGTYKSRVCESFVYSTDKAMGPFSKSITGKTLKKGKSFSKTVNGKSAYLEFFTPGGVKSMKLKVTISTTNGKALIKSFKKLAY